MPLWDWSFIYVCMAIDDVRPKVRELIWISEHDFEIKSTFLFNPTDNQSNRNLYG